MSALFTGTGVALVTPFKSNKAIDFPALEKLVNHVIAGGVNYLVALGTTAETPTLSSEEKKAVLAHIISVNAGRIPVVCGLGGNNTSEVAEQLKQYDLSGVAGILSVGPYYNKPSQEGYYQHFKTIAESTDKPIILYNVPGRTGSNIAAETSIRLAKEFKNIVGIKEASGNMAQCMELVQNSPEGFILLSGDDNLVFPQIALGFKGVISVAANCFTRDFCTMVQHALRSENAEARALHYKLLNATDALFAEGNPAGVKYVLAKMGIIENELRLPLVPVSAGLAAKMDSLVTGLV